MHRIDLLAILSLIVGISSLSADATFSAQLSTMLGGHASQVLAVLGMLGTVASTVLRVYGNPTTAQTITQLKENS